MTQKQIILMNKIILVVGLTAIFSAFAFTFHTISVQAKAAQIEEQKDYPIKCELALVIRALGENAPDQRTKEIYNFEADQLEMTHFTTTKKQ